MPDLMKTLINKTKVSKSKIHGWGVFAKCNIKKGEVIEECLFLKTPKDIKKNCKSIRNYIFQYYGCNIISLGNGSLYNHSNMPNAKYITNRKMNKLIFIAEKDIKKEQEILTSYSEKYWKCRKINPK